jgi:thiol-disulfide isomerase/thioredoxin
MILAGIGVLAGAILLADDGPLTYPEAYRLAVAEGKPLVILVGAEWCPGCKLMQRELIPRLREKRLFGHLAFAAVDVDREPKLSRQLVGDGPIPQLLVFRQVAGKWRMVRLIGFHEFEVVEKQINRINGIGKLQPTEPVADGSACVPPPPPRRMVSSKPSDLAPRSGTGS